LGSLRSELDTCDEGVKRTSARLLDVPMAWLEQEFRYGDVHARELANALMSAYEGAALLTNTFCDPKSWYASVADWSAGSTLS
jgi:hypothetical protein